ncbi:MAG: hypothetical protein KAU17_13740 [Spirochaetales bacterium]|nr:hypothetical protein [Spirochaetales bacterium]
MILLVIFLGLYGLFCIVLGLFKVPSKVWNMGKIEGFKKFLGVIGTQIFLAVWGGAALAGGIILLVNNVLK